MGLIQSHELSKVESFLQLVTGREVREMNCRKAAAPLPTWSWRGPCEQERGWPLKVDCSPLLVAASKEWETSVL